MRRMKRWGVVVAACVFTTGVQATASLPLGWYLEGNVGTSRSSDVNYGAETTISNNGLGGNINVGYKFIPYFLGEVGYTKYSDAYGKFQGTKVADDSHYALDIAGRGILPLSDTGVELFAKLGLVRVQSHVTLENASVVNANGLVIQTGSHSASSYFIGFGADYAVRPNILLNLQWQRAKGDSRTGRLDLYSLGLGYLFV